MNAREASGTRGKDTKKMSDHNPNSQPFQYTKGEWDMSGPNPPSFPTQHWHYEIGSKSSMHWIAHVLCFGDVNDGSEYEGNAKLIANSGRMWELIKNFVECECSQSSYAELKGSQSQDIPVEFLALCEFAEEMGVKLP